MSEENIATTPETDNERDYREELLSIIRSSDKNEEIKEKLSDYHDSDIADVLPLLTHDERKKLYLILGEEGVSDVFSYLEGDDVLKYTDELSSEKVADIIENMDADDAVDVLEELDEDRKNEIIELLGDDAKEDINLINSYDDDCIGSKMTTNYVAVNKNLSLKHAMKEVVKQASENDNITTIYTVEDNGTYYGAIQLKDLFTAKLTEQLDDIISLSYPYVYASEDISNCIERLKSYDEDSIPVLDDNNVLIGVITADDVVQVVDEELSEDYAKFAAVSSEEDKDESVFKSLFKRLPWLIILLVLGLVVSSVTGLFEHVITALPFIVFCQSLILGMSGNVGTQSLAVTIRVLSEEELTAKQKFAFVFKEIKVAFTTGFVAAITAFVFSFLYMLLVLKGSGTGEIALTALCISVSLLVAMVFAGFTGAITPIVFNKLHIDPAVASGPLITTLVDLASVSIYYGLAILLLM